MYCHISVFLSLVSGHLLLSWLLFLPIETVSDDRAFSIHLGNIPADVILEEVRINGKQLMMSESAERGYSISPVNINGSQAYKLRLPFEDAVVHSMVSAPHRTCILLTCFGSFSYWCLLGSSTLSCHLTSHHICLTRINSTVTTLQKNKSKFNQSKFSFRNRAENRGNKSKFHDNGRMFHFVFFMAMSQFRLSINQDFDCYLFLGGFGPEFHLVVGWVDSWAGCDLVLASVWPANTSFWTRLGLICVFSLNEAWLLIFEFLKSKKNCQLLLFI